MVIGSDKDSQKKMIGELLKAADRYIKSSEWTKALAEVGKALAIEPNNMYAMAYKDRINVSLSDGKKKAEEEKVKQISEERKASEKKSTPAPEEKKVQEESTPEPISSAQTQPEIPKEEKKSETSNSDRQKEDVKSSGVKDDSAARVESLRQEFAATQAKLQREVAQLTMQVREAQALKEAIEKNLNAQLAAVQKELASAKSQPVKTDTKELDALKKENETLKSKLKKDVESAQEIAKAEMLTQVAVLQKELEAVKKSADSETLQKHGEMILKDMFQKAWQDGSISDDERALLMVIKGAIEMTESKFGEMETSAKSEAYINAVRTVWMDGVVTPDESDFLSTLREKLGIPAEEHFRLESQVRKQTKK